MPITPRKSGCVSFHAIDSGHPLFLQLLTFNFQSVPRRHRGNVMQHRKPRWIPLANSTLLRPPAQDFTPQSEHEQMNVLKVAYNERLSAIVQYLYEDYLIYSDVGEAAREAARREQKEHERLLEENQRDNQRVAALRDQRQKVEREQREKEILQKVAEKKRLDEQKRQETEELVGEVIEDMANLVTMENLVENIEKALDEPLDYEYAIDLQGHIYRGR